MRNAKFPVPRSVGTQQIKLVPKKKSRAQNGPRLTKFGETFILDITSGVNLCDRLKARFFTNHSKYENAAFSKYKCRGGKMLKW